MLLSWYLEKGHIIGLYIVIHVCALHLFCKGDFITGWHRHPFFPETIRDRSLITGRGATKWENPGSETFCTPFKTG